MRRALPALAALWLATAAHAARAAEPAMQTVRRSAEALVPLVQTELARQFVEAYAALPPPPSRTVYRDTLGGGCFSSAEAESLPDTLRSRLKPDPVEGLAYYGWTLNYARVFDLLGAAGFDTFDQRRVLDFGYGRVGHLRALASLGAAVVGVDIDPLLRALYSGPGDQGEVRGKQGRVGTLALVSGWFPGDSATRAAVGSGYDLVISKNTLKGGHSPEERTRQRRVIDLRVSDSVFVRGMAACLKPGGLFMMYTISTPRGNPSCPFTEAMLREAGFEIVVYDGYDSPGARVMMSALNAGRERDDDVVDAELIARYTLVRRAPEGGSH